jgi:hypothetical protein
MVDGYVRPGMRHVGPIDEEEIEHRFGFHKATIEGPENSAAKHRYLRRQFVLFATMLNEQLEHPSREGSLALTALEEASMWAHKAIAADDELVVEDNKEKI